MTGKPAEVWMLSLLRPTRTEVTVWAWAAVEQSAKARSRQARERRIIMAEWTATADGFPSYFFLRCPYINSSANSTHLYSISRALGSRRR